MRAKYYSKSVILEHKFESYCERCVIGKYIINMWRKEHKRDIITNTSEY